MYVAFDSSLQTEPFELDRQIFVARHHRSLLIDPIAEIRTPSCPNGMEFGRVVFGAIVARQDVIIGYVN